MHIHRKLGCPKCVVKQIYTTQYYEANNIHDHEAMLYIVLFENDHEKFLKVGITKHENIKYRFRGYKDYKIVVLLGIKSTFFKAYPVEQSLLKKFEPFKYQPLSKFKGHTEALHLDCKNQLLSSVLEIAADELL